MYPRCAHRQTSSAADLAARQRTQQLQQNRCNGLCATCRTVVWRSNLFGELRLSM
jgi:hypothetical protein